MKQLIVRQETASKYQNVIFPLILKMMILAGGIKTTDVTVHAVQQGSFITHHTVTTMD